MENKKLHMGLNGLEKLDKQECLRILEEVKENINICCAITMEPDEVLELIEKIEVYIKENDQREI